MKKNELEIEKSFIDYLVKTIKENDLASLEITRSLTDQQKLKIKISNSNPFSSQQETNVTKDYSSEQRQDFIRKDDPSNTSLTGPGFRLVRSGACLGVIAISPAPPSALNSSTGPEKSSPSGLTMLHWIVDID